MKRRFCPERDKCGFVDVPNGTISCIPNQDYREVQPQGKHMKHVISSREILVSNGAAVAQISEKICFVKQESYNSLQEL